MASRESLIQDLLSYTSAFEEENQFRESFLTLLQHPRSFYRDHLPGHITASAWIINESRTHVLLVLHAKLGKWLQPGGHADGDDNVLRVAVKETEEETGLKNVKPSQTSFFDIDIHMIPARKEMPEHFHYDVRFLFQASDQDALAISEESRELRWVPLSDLKSLTGNNVSIMRMADKTITL